MDFFSVYLVDDDSKKYNNNIIYLFKISVTAMHVCGSNHAHYYIWWKLKLKFQI